MLIKSISDQCVVDPQEVIGTERFTDNKINIYLKNGTKLSYTGVGEHVYLDFLKRLTAAANVLDEEEG